MRALSDQSMGRRASGTTNALAGPGPSTTGEPRVDYTITGSPLTVTSSRPPDGQYRAST